MIINNSYPYFCPFIRQHFFIVPAIHKIFRTPSAHLQNLAASLFRLCCRRCRCGRCFFIRIVYAVLYKLKTLGFAEAFYRCSLVCVAGAAVCVFDASDWIGHGFYCFVVLVVYRRGVGLPVYGGLVIVFGQVLPMLRRLGRCLRFGVLPRPVRPVLGLRPHRAARFGACRWRGNFLLRRGGRCGFFEVSPKIIKAV